MYFPITSTYKNNAAENIYKNSEILNFYTINS